MSQDIRVLVNPPQYQKGVQAALEAAGYTVVTDGLLVVREPEPTPEVLPDPPANAA